MNLHFLKQSILIKLLIGFLLGLIGMGTWRVAGSLYYDLKFLHEQRDAYDRAVLLQQLRQQQQQQAPK